MRASSFHDILNQFLEEKSTSPKNPAPSRPTQAPTASPHVAEFAFIFPHSPPRAAAPRGRPYGHSGARDLTQNATPLTGQRQRADLSPDGMKALDTLMGLGALELEESLSLDVLKKAYRRLLKFYHPDHNPLGLTAEDRAQRVEKFWSLRRAFAVVEAEIKKGPQGALSESKAA